MTDIEKTKIDILRDALKDASDTVRALDRKINFLVSYNAIFLGVISTLFFKYKDLKLIINNHEVFYSILGVIGFIWVCAFIGMMMGISPKSDPVEVFNNEIDKEFSKDTFFIWTDGKKNSLKLDKLLDNYNKINSYSEVQKLLYKEIGKVSYIRDLKLNSVSKSVWISWILTLIFVLFVTISAIYSSFDGVKYNTIKNENNSSVKNIKVSYKVDSKSIDILNNQEVGKNNRTVIKNLSTVIDNKDNNESK